MSDPNPGLSDQDLQRVGDYVRGNLNSWLTEVAPQIFIGPQLLERMARVEEQIKAHGELMATRFEAIDRRFEAVDRQFESVDQRFESVDMRFESIDKRFDAVDKRFESVDKRFDAVDKRFDAVDKRFEAMDKRFGMLQWMIGSGFTALLVMMSIYEFIS